MYREGEEEKGRRGKQVLSDEEEEDRKNGVEEVEEIKGVVVVVAMGGSGGRGGCRPSSYRGRKLGRQMEWKMKAWRGGQLERVVERGSK